MSALDIKAEEAGLARKTIYIEAEAAAVEWGEIQAAEGSAEKIPQFKMTAYTGALMRVDGFFHPVIVDLAGVKVAAKTIPMLRQHDPNRIVGHGEAVVSANDIQISGLISADNTHAREVSSSSKRGFPWQASIGAQPTEPLEFLKKGEKAVVNGRAVSGPALIARKSELRETSFVPLGADRKTSAKVTASEADTDAAPKPAGLTITCERRGLSIAGSGSTFLTVRELEQFLSQLRST